VTDRFPEPQMIGRAPLRMRDIIRVLQTGVDLVEYVAQTSRTNAAATVAEATGSGDGTGVVPESAAAFEVRQAAVKTIGTWSPVTKQAVADVPQMRGIIDTELRENLDAKLEDQILNGLGTGSELTGIYNTSNTQTQAWSTNILTTTRKAKTLVGTVAFRVPTAYVLNPADWETIDLLQDNEARYFYGGPAQVGVPRLWGLPVVEAAANVAGYALVGDFNKAILWDREQANVAISDSHNDFFTRLMLAIRADLRCAFAAVQPTAFVEIDVAA
jgi:HK97 family phage major capsid protein